MFNKILILFLVGLLLVGGVTAWVYKEDFSDAVRNWKVFGGLDTADIYYDKVTEGKGQDKNHTIYYKVQLKNNHSMQDFMREVLPYQDQFT